VTVARAVLSAGWGSACQPATRAVLVPEVSTGATTVNDMLAPGTSGAAPQVSSLLTSLKTQPAGTLTGSARCDGHQSVTAAPVATLGPALLTERLNS
jgi:hypothetical protein